MTEKIITITTKDAEGRNVKKDLPLAYCFATEIAYKYLSGEDITDFMQEAVKTLSGENPRMPDIKRTIYAILAAAMAHEEATGTKSSVTDKDLMTTATPQELGVALGTVLALRAEFYHVPKDEPKDSVPDGSASGKKGKGKRKNA